MRKLSQTIVLLSVIAVAAPVLAAGSGQSTSPSRAHHHKAVATGAPHRPAPSNRGRRRPIGVKPTHRPTTTSAHVKRKVTTPTRAMAHPAPSSRVLGEAPPPAPIQVTSASPAEQDLQFLLQENARQTALLQAQAKHLGKNHAQQFTWSIMIQDYNDDVSRLTAALKSMGVTPTVMPATITSEEEMDPQRVQTALKSHQDLLRTVRLVKPKVHGAARDALDHMQSALENHLNLLRSLQRGLPITGV